MKKEKASIFCRTFDKLDDSLYKQQAFLEEFALSHHYEIMGCYLDCSCGPLSMDNKIHLRLLRAAKRGELGVILIESFSRFPAFDPQKTPPLCLYCVCEKKMLSSGNILLLSKDPPPESPEGIVLLNRNKKTKNSC